MTARFSVSASPYVGMVTITLAGFFQAADVEQFEAACALEHRKLRCVANQHVTLVDVRGLGIQSPGTLDRFAKILTDPAFRSRRAAVIYSPSLVVRQLQRLTADHWAAYFLDPEAARRWLSRFRQKAA